MTENQLPAPVAERAMRAALDNVVHALMVLPVPIDGAGKRAWTSLLDAQKVLEAALAHPAALSGGDSEPAGYTIVERDDDMFITQPHWQWGSLCIARRPKLMSNDQWRPLAQRIVAALAAAPKAPRGEAERISNVVLSWMAENDLIEAGEEYSAEDVLTVLNSIGRAIASPPPVEPALGVTEAMAERFSAGVSKYWQGRRSGRDGDAIMAGLTAALAAEPEVSGGGAVKRMERWKVPAHELDDTELDLEYASAAEKFDNRGEHGGSPGEFWVERMDEIEQERKRRAGSSHP